MNIGAMGAAATAEQPQNEPQTSRFGAGNSENVPSLRPYGRRKCKAPLAQSVERFHGKEKVNGSIPLGGSVDARRSTAASIGAV